mmetsp:Transcript_18957/g.43208  ORF Transcript_18957/g.43208 Transcript_18957/m.43208 type:complete len:85 (-) Transcript_18957:80-334(-)
MRILKILPTLVVRVATVTIVAGKGGRKKKARDTGVAVVQSALKGKRRLPTMVTNIAFHLSSIVHLMRMTNKLLLTFYDYRQKQR